MKVECSGCASVYNIDDTKIPEAGARVKCPKCQNIIVVKKPLPELTELEESVPEQATPRNESPEINKSSSPQTKNCPYCAEVILAAATRCKHCGSDLRPGQATGPKKDTGELFGILMLCCPVIAAMLIWFWVGSMNLLQNPRSALTFITVATIIVTAILAAVEANQLGFGRSSSGKKETGPIGFFLGILLLWVVSYPYYLYQRRKKGKKNLLVGGIVVALVFMLSLLSMNVAISQNGFDLSLNSITEYATRGRDDSAYSDTRNACTAQEAYFVDNERYADSINKLPGDVYGLYLSENVVMHTSTTPNGQQYFIAAFHTKGSKVFSVSGPGGVITTVTKESVLPTAILNGDYSFAKALIAKGADVNAKDGDGLTPLIYAVHGGHSNIIRELIAKGADVNAKSKDGITALIYAAVLGQTEIVRELIARGADVNVQLENGATALKAAENKGYSEIAKLLRKAGAKYDNSSSGVSARNATVTHMEAKHDSNTSGWKFLKWGMSPSEVEALLKSNGFLNTSRKLSDYQEKQILLDYGLQQCVHTNDPKCVFCKTLGNPGPKPYSFDIEITQGLTGYTILRQEESSIETGDTFIFYEGELMAVVTIYHEGEGAERGLFFAEALKEKYGGKIFETLDMTVIYLHESKSLRIIMGNYWSGFFCGTRINYCDPNTVNSMLKAEVNRAQDQNRKKANETKKLL